MDKKEHLEDHLVAYNLMVELKSLKNKNHKDYPYYLPNLESNLNQN